MKIFLDVLGGLATVAFYLFVAFSVNRGFEEIVVGGLALIYTSLSYGFASNTVGTSQSHFNLWKSIARATNTIKDEYLTEETEETAQEIIREADKALESGQDDLGKAAILSLIMTVLSVGLVVKGALAY